MKPQGVFLQTNKNLISYFHHRKELGFCNKKKKKGKGGYKETKICERNMDQWKPNLAITIQLGFTNCQASSFWLGGDPASQPHMPPEPCLCFAFKAACSDAAFCRRRSSNSFCNVSIVWSFCRSSATSTCRFKDKLANVFPTFPHSLHASTSMIEVSYLTNLFHLVIKCP